MWCSSMCMMCYPHVEQGGGKRSRNATTASSDVVRASGTGSTSRLLTKLAPPRHEHNFLPDETYDHSTDAWTKRCECGFTLEYERM